MVKGKAVTKEDFLNTIREIKKSGIVIKRDKTCAHFPLYKIEDNSPELLQIGYCYLPRTHTIPRTHSKRRGISVTVSLHKGSCRMTLYIVKQIYDVLQDADWYFDDSGYHVKHPIEHIKEYIRISKTKLKRTK